VFSSLHKRQINRLNAMGLPWIGALLSRGRNIRDRLIDDETYVEQKKACLN
jgi:hypothetical protein